MSQVPAFALVGLLVAAVLLVVLAAWLARGLRGAGGVAGRVSVAVLVGVAGAFVTLVVLGMRHYGGSTRSGSSTLYNCDQWYQEAALPSDRAAEAGDLSATCRHDAIAAIWPGVGLAALIGLGVGLLTLAGVLVLGRVRAGRAAAPPKPAVRYVDTDS